MSAETPGNPLPSALMQRMPVVRGKMRANAELAKTNWFQVGGPAELLFRPEDVQDLADFIARKPSDMPVTVIGVGSNLLVRDGGLDGIVIRLGRGFTEINVDGDAVLAGAGALDIHVAETALMHGLTGLEFLSGIPGTIGGALAMNAGAYGKDVAGTLISAELVDDKGQIRTLSVSELDYTYRHCGVPESWIFTRGLFKATPGDKQAIAAEMQRIANERSDSQPIRSRTGGSTFKNPDGHKAWELIDKAGCRGLEMGAAQVSVKHCNFLINNGGASASDLENLGEEVRRRVQAQSGILLEWEIKRIGKQA